MSKTAFTGMFCIVQNFWLKLDRSVIGSKLPYFSCFNDIATDYEFLIRFTVA